LERYLQQCDFPATRTQILFTNINLSFTPSSRSPILLTYLKIAADVGISRINSEKGLRMKSEIAKAYTARLRQGAAIAALTCAMCASAANAQEVAAPVPTAATPVTVDTAAAIDEDVIVVTGSRIARPDLQASSPVAVVSSETLKLASKTGVEEFLRNIPQAVAGIGSSNNNGNPGVATVNLRNLGEERTLVLVDGKRFVPYDSEGKVDLNMIPSALVERVEVVTGGASAVYGSDAIAGVVNFIMKKDFVGIEADGQYGITQKGDGWHRDFSLTAGTNLGDRGNVVVNGTYSKQQKVTQGERKFSNVSLGQAELTPDGASSTNAFGSLDGIAAGADPVAQPGGRYTFTPGGFVPYDVSRDGFNFNPYNLLQVPHEKYTATLIANYELTDSVEYYARVSYGKTKIRTELAPTGTFGFTFDINYNDNPFLNPAINPNAAGAIEALRRTDFAEADDLDTPDVNEAAGNGDGIVRLGNRRRVTEAGPRIQSYQSKAFQVVNGLKGDFSDSLHWEVSGQYGKSRRTLTELNDLTTANVQQALLAVDGPDGPVCSDPSNGCAPANLFGFGTLSPEAVAFIKAPPLVKKDTAEQWVFGGFLSGDLPFTLMSDKPGAFVVGAEYRREKATARPDANLIVGTPGFGPETPLTAKFNVKEVYAELQQPIITDRPGIYSLKLEAAVRYSDYKNATAIDTGTAINKFSNSFKNWTWKIGGDYAPTRDVRFRAMYQRAVRAPNLNEIGNPITAGTGDADFDPCASGTFDPTNATLVGLCNTVGGGFPFGVAPGSIGQPTSGQVNNFSGGNPNLVPEKANTITLGAVFTPTFLTGFTASIDYFDIKVKKAILQTPEQAIIDACYYAEQDPNGLFCSLIHRNQRDGSLEGDVIYGVDASDRNIGLLRSRGIDFAGVYTLPLSAWGKLSVGINLTRQLKSDVQFASVLNTYSCAGKLGKTCLNPDPKWRWTQTTTLEVGQFTGQLTWRHIGKISKDALTVGYNLTDPSDYAVPTIKAFNYFDLAGSFEVNDNFGFRFGIDNLFNKKPPIVGNDYGGTTQNSGNTYPATYDTLGRSFYVGANVKL
jgi:outer membrane receptor protein involved in Fe transport